MTSVSLIHPWNSCEACKSSPIVGTRYECQTCPLGPDSDFCASCYEKIQTGVLAHPSPQNQQASDLKGQKHVFKSFEGILESSTSAWFEVPFVSADAPKVPNGFVLRPEFSAGLDTTFAGYSFVVLAPKPTLLTAYHVMDEMLRLKRIDATDQNANYRGDELPAVLKKVNLYDVYAANWMMAFVTEAGPMWVLPNARIRDEEPFADRDIAAFQIKNPAGTSAGKLASATPAVGEPVWLAASWGGTHPVRSFPAVVVSVTARSFLFRFQGTGDLPSYTSGAPILNQAGEVVAINVGGGKWNGQRFGHGNHVLNIRQHLGFFDES